MRIKACGITNLEDALSAVKLGYDAIGFVFYGKSKRYIPPVQAASIIKSLPPFITTVGIFVNEREETVKKILMETGIEVAQFHGNETPDYVKIFSLKTIKAFGIHEKFDFSRLSNYKVSAFLLDTYTEETPGGSGKSFEWSLAKNAAPFGPIILAGGLNSENVNRAIMEAEPFAVDASSGIESYPGKKSYRKMLEFIKAIRQKND